LDHKDGAKFLTKNQSRVSRIARGSGTLPKEVQELLVQHGKFAQVGMPSILCYIFNFYG